MESKQDLLIEHNILDLNRTAMSLLRDKQFNPALKCLQEALKTLNKLEAPEKKLKLQGITFNNLGCFYKRSKMPNVALQYLKKAYVIEKDGLVDSVNLAATHLNICTIYSELGKHEISLKESLQALQLMKNSADYSPNFVSTLAIAYYNTGVEYEFLKCFNESLEYYKYAWDTAEKYLGPNHGLTCSMRKNFEAAEKNLKGKEFSKVGISHEFVLNKSKSRVSSAKSRPKSGKVSFRNKPLNKNLAFNSTNYSANAGSKVAGLGLQNVRFLTGDRMQPMHSLGPRVQSAPRSRIQGQKSSKSFQNATIQVKVKKHEEKPLSHEKKHSKIDSKYLKDLENRFSQRKKMENAALKIQKCFRGFKSRKMVIMLKHKKLLKEKTMNAIKELDEFKAQNETLSIEKSLKSSNKVGLRNQTSLKMTEKNIFLLQSLIRGFNCRCLLEKQVKSAILIQKTVKKYQVQKIYKKIKEAILFVQSFYRGYLVRKHYLLTS